MDLNINVSELILYNSTSFAARMLSNITKSHYHWCLKKIEHTVKDFILNPSVSEDLKNFVMRWSVSMKQNMG
ncbi:unnamed protein product [Rhizophagus irregularis]|nr:unnamed protein product [Rhizophagus irregularis]